LSSRTNGAFVAAIPWFAAAAKPRLTSFRITLTPGWSATARSALPSRDALSTTTVSSVTSPADDAIDARHRPR
jgi:hypothetical protein